MYWLYYISLHSGTLVSNILDMNFKTSKKLPRHLLQNDGPSQELLENINLARKFVPIVGFGKIF